MTVDLGTVIELAVIIVGGVASHLRLAGKVDVIAERVEGVVKKNGEHDDAIKELRAGAGCQFPDCAYGYRLRSNPGAGAAARLADPEESRPT